MAPTGAGRSTVSAAGEPRTEAGQAHRRYLHAIVHGPNADGTYDCKDGCECAADILAIETEAAASPAGPEAVPHDACGCESCACPDPSADAGAVPQNERAGEAEGGVRRLEPYLHHLSDCEHIQPVDEAAWRSAPCTCPKETWWGDHEVGCPRAAAFRSFMDALVVPDCSCGLDAIRAALASPAHPDEEER